MNLEIFNIFYQKLNERSFTQEGEGGVMGETYFGGRKQITRLKSEKSTLVRTSQYSFWKISITLKVHNL